MRPIPSTQTPPWLLHLRWIALASVAALIWIAHFDRWTVESWRVPTDYYGDAHESLARLKAAAEGDVLPLRAQVISRLGAPFGAHWNAYPAPDKPLMLGLGGAVHALGLFAAANLGLLLAQVTAALAFYFVARWLRCRWEWAAAGALLFAYTYHTFHRGLAHISLVFTWTVPLGLLAVWLVADSRRLQWRRPGAWVCLAAALALGTANPYNLFFWLQLMAWALVWQWLRGRRDANLQIGLATMAVSLAAFALAHAETWLYVETPDALPLLARNYGGTEVYALKAAEMFIPPPFHHWDWLAFFGQRYARWSVWRGEVFLPYLGLAGIAGFVWLMIVTLRQVAARRAPPRSALAIAWILGYAMLGGITNLLALFAEFQVFRATNRAAIFISAIVLFFLVMRLSRWSMRWPAWQRMGAAALLAAIGVFEQLPRPDSAQETAALAAEVRADEQFGAAMEAALPAGAMVFQLPVLGFPEVKPPYHLGDYDHFRPYLATEELRFSYGAAKGRSRSRWQRELEGLATPELVRHLEAHGFAAIYVNRRGYEDGGAKLLRELSALGYPTRIEAADGNQLLVPLKPSQEAAPPLAAGMTYGQGWHQMLEEGWHWAFDDAALSYFNPFSEPIKVDLKLTVVGATPREVVMEHEGEPVMTIAAAATPSEIIVPEVELAPGVNRFKLRSPARAIRQNAGRNQLRSFALREAVVRPCGPRATPPRLTQVLRSPVAGAQGEVSALTP